VVRAACGSVFTSALRVHPHKPFSRRRRRDIVTALSQLPAPEVFHIMPLAEVSMLLFHLSIRDADQKMFAHA
jgi:hypothetical protein